MKWFDQWFARKCQWAWKHRDDEIQQAECVPTPGGSIAADHHGLHDGMSIHLKQVIGGRIVTFHRYDRKRDENLNRTYIITDEQDFERELGKIITLEAMRS